MKVLFISEASREYPSTICMAMEPIEYLKKSGISVSFLRGGEILESGVDFAFKDLDIVVFVKACNIKLLKSAHDKKIKTIWYADESLMPEYELMLDNKKYLDSIISTCDAYTELCRNLGFDTQIIQTIYHHHCNFENEAVEFRDEVKNVGFIGMDDQLHYKDKFENFLNKQGCNLFADQAACAFKKNLFEALRGLDLGIIFIDKNRCRENDGTGGLSGFEQNWGDRIKYRSNTKIVNFISFGIPSVTVPYNSYVEILKDKPQCCLFVDTFEQACHNLDMLIKNKNLRKRIRNNCLDTRDSFHLSTLVKDFIFLFDTVLRKSF